MTKETDRAAIIDALRIAKARIAFLQAAYCKDKAISVRINDEVIQKIDTALAALRARYTGDDN
ncbi:MAG: hypothetical protein ABSG12_07505 [Steroidobacteraceae bacterium]|jgi:hypothetical protein